MKMTRYNYLTQYVSVLAPHTIMEIGTWNGDHAALMINEALKARKSVHYYGFDLWEQMNAALMKEEVSKWPPAKRKVDASLKKTGANITLIQGNTKVTIPQFTETSSVDKIDFIFVDGGHAFETVAADWQNIQPLIGKDTVVLFDDYWYPPKGPATFGCNRVIDNLDPSKWSVRELPASDTFKHGRVHFVEVKSKRDSENI